MTNAQRPIDSIYTLVKNALTEITEGLHSAQSVYLAIDTVLTLVHQAVADFAETWNDEVPSCIFSLPNELRVACLSQLPFRDRVTASHISRGWRQLLLANATLWNFIPKRQWPPTQVAAFDAMLSRTGSAPLDLERLFLGPIPFPVQTDKKAVAHRRLRVLLDIAIPRLRSLDISVSPKFSFGDNASFLWNSPAPMLESLVVDHHGSVQIPESWWQRLVPRLRSLRMGIFQLPSSPDPANKLEVFSGAMHRPRSNSEIEESADARLLFVHFPHLVSLTLQSVFNTSVLPNTPPPSCLRHIDLRGTSPSPAMGDVTSFLGLCRSIPLKTMTVHYFEHFTLDDALEYFSSTPWHPSGPWEMTMSRGPETVSMKAQDGTGLELQIVPILPSTQTTLHGASYFDTLRSLRLEDTWILTFLRAGINLPMLASLSISDMSRINSVLALALEDATLLPLRVPALEQLTFAHVEAMWVYSDSEELTISRLPDFIRSRLRYDAALLRRIIVTSDSGLDIDLYVRPLRALASEVHYEGAKGTMHTLHDTDRDAERVEVDDGDDVSFPSLVPLGA